MFRRMPEYECGALRGVERGRRSEARRVEMYELDKLFKSIRKGRVLFFIQKNIKKALRGFACQFEPRVCRAQSSVLVPAQWVGRVSQMRRPCCRE